ncbi:MAG: hypothetical protein ABGW77_02155 [Campylobacterales bacterium]
MGLRRALLSVGIGVGLGFGAEVIGVLKGPSPSSKQFPPSPSTPRQLIGVPPSTIKVGNGVLELRSGTVIMDYQEFGDSEKVVLDRDYTDPGDLNGVEIDFRTPFYFIEGALYQGSSHYTGSTWDGQSVSSLQTGVILFNGRIGVTFPGGGPYFVAGYRSWWRGTSDSPGDYNEHYYWKYLGLGYRGEFQFGELQLTPSAEWERGIHPEMKAYLGSEPTFDLGEVTGLRLELPLCWRLNPYFSLLLQYRFQYWYITGSGPTPAVIDGQNYTLYEPPSKTYLHYFSWGFSLSF